MPPALNINLVGPVAAAAVPSGPSTPRPAAPGAMLRLPKLTAPKAPLFSATTPVSSSPAHDVSAPNLRPAESVHITQYQSAFNPDGPSFSSDCGPAAVVMGLRMLGKDVPNSFGSTDHALRAARMIATGSADRSQFTFTDQLKKVADSAKVHSSLLTDVDAMIGAAKRGDPVVVWGNGSHTGTWYDRLSPTAVPRAGDHYVTLSSHGGKLMVNDPLSSIGAIEVPESELRSFANVAGRTPSGLRMSAG